MTDEHFDHIEIMKQATRALRIVLGSERILPIPIELNTVAERLGEAPVTGEQLAGLREMIGQQSVEKGLALAVLDLVHAFEALYVAVESYQRSVNDGSAEGTDTRRMSRQSAQWLMRIFTHDLDEIVRLVTDG